MLKAGGGEDMGELSLLGVNVLCLSFASYTMYFSVKSPARVHCSTKKKAKLFTI